MCIDFLPPSKNVHVIELSIKSSVDSVKLNSCYDLEFTDLLDRLSATPEDLLFSGWGQMPSNGVQFIG